MIRTLRIPAAAIVFAAAAFGALSEGELRGLFEEANAAFREGNELATKDPSASYDRYRAAALRYERLINEGGVLNSKLFYNLGNAYFRTDEIGRAILNYRRAELLAPGDSNVGQNLDFARSRRQDRFDDTTEQKALRTLLFWHYDLSAHLRLLLLTLFSGAFWVLATVRLFRPEAISKIALWTLGGFAFLFASSVTAGALFGAGDRYAVVLAPESVARLGDSSSYEPAFKEPLHEGAEVRLIEQRGDWLHIELPDARDAWIPARDAELVHGVFDE